MQRAGHQLARGLVAGDQDLLDDAQRRTVAQRFVVACVGRLHQTRDEVVARVGAPVLELRDEVALILQQAASLFEGAVGVDLGAEGQRELIRPTPEVVDAVIGDAEGGRDDVQRQRCRERLHELDRLPLGDLGQQVGHDLADLGFPLRDEPRRERARHHPAVVVVFGRVGRQQRRQVLPPLCRDRRDLLGHRVRRRHLGQPERRREHVVIQQRLVNQVLRGDEPHAPTRDEVHGRIAAK